MASARVLSVGQCGFDNSTLKRFLKETCDADFEAVDTGAQVFKRLQSASYNLVLVNRVLDEDGSSGIDLIRQLADSAPNSQNPPALMLVSNYEDAQTQAVEAGALPGFGKSSLNTPETLIRLRAALASD